MFQIKLDRTGFEGVEDYGADVIGQDILLKALFGGAVDYHLQ